MQIERKWRRMMMYELSEIAPRALEYAEREGVSFHKTAQIFLPRYYRSKSQKNMRLLKELMTDLKEKIDAEQEIAEKRYEFDTFLVGKQRHDELLPEEN